jgi:RimJ/RimL family protein N-acetyltransferase
MITVERSTDYPLLTWLATSSPLVYNAMCYDFSPPADQYRVPEGDHLIYLLAKDDGLPRGFWCFVPQNAVCYEVHTVAVPEFYGAKVLEAAGIAQRWIWDNTPCRRIITNVPEFNRLALRFAQKAGMTIFGVNEKSYIKGHKLIDQIMLGMSKPD